MTLHDTPVSPFLRSLPSSQLALSSGECCATRASQHRCIAACVPFCDCYPGELTSIALCTSLPISSVGNLKGIWGAQYPTCFGKNIPENERECSSNLTVRKGPAQGGTTAQAQALCRRSRCLPCTAPPCPLQP